MNMSKNISLLIGLVVVIAVIVGVGYLISGKKANQPASTILKEEQLESISPDELGLKITVRSDKKAIKFQITNPAGITTIEYELSYLAKGDIPRGVIGNIEVKSASSAESPYLDLGSCSASVCKYDEGVHSLRLVLKITKTDGKVFQSEKEISL